MAYSQYNWAVGGEDVAYGHSTGRLRLLETKLLTSAELENLIRQNTRSEDWQQVLDRLGYPKADDLLSRISLAGIEADKLLMELGVDKALAYGLLLHKNYHNLKVFLKALLPNSDFNKQLDGQQNISILTGLKDLTFAGSYEDINALWKLVISILSEPITQIELPIKYSDFTIADIGLDELQADSFIRTRIPPIFKQAIIAAKQVYIAQAAVGYIDVVLDQFYFAHLTALAEYSKLSFLSTYAQLKADIANLNILYRAKLLNLPSTSLEALLVSSKRDNMDKLVKLPTADLITWQEAFATSPVLDLVGLAYDLANGKTADNYQNDGQFEAFGSFARAADNMLLSLARTGLSVVYGPQVVAGYWLARQNEMQNLRLIISLLAQGKESKVLLSLLREAYING